MTQSGVHGVRDDTDQWSRQKIAGVFLAALAIIFDGFDNQALGLAVASIARDWAVAPASFAGVAFVGLAGMTVGTAIAGVLGDRFGRRTMMICSVALFGALTVSTAFVGSMAELTAVRFLTGLGLGGAMPNATALAAEFSPTRARPMAVTVTIVCVPLGGLLGGLVAATILPEHGWRAMFAVAGVAPLILAGVLWLYLPESPRFLAAQQEASPDGAAASRAGPSALGQLFDREFRTDTLAVWAAFFLCLIAVYTAFSWLPATLSGAGFDQKTASLGLASFNFGGVAGALIAAAVITRLGSRRAMSALACVGVAIAALVLLINAGSLTHAALMAALGILGFSVNGVQTTLFALASHIYPARIRATGVGAALGFGRVGAMASSLAGSFLLAGGNTSAFFLVLALAMGGTVIALLCITRHIPAGAAVDRSH